MLHPGPLLATAGWVSTFGAPLCVDVVRWEGKRLPPETWSDLALSCVPLAAARFFSIQHSAVWTAAHGSTISISQPVDLAGNQRTHRTPDVCTRVYQQLCACKAHVSSTVQPAPEREEHADNPLRLQA